MLRVILTHSVRSDKIQVKWNTVILYCFPLCLVFSVFLSQEIQTQSFAGLLMTKFQEVVPEEFGEKSQ